MWNFTGYLFYCFLDRERKANHTRKWSPWPFILQLCSGLHSKAFFTINSKHGQFILRLISSTSTGVKHLVLIMFDFLCNKKYRFYPEIWSHQPPLMYSFTNANALMRATMPGSGPTVGLDIWKAWSTCWQLLIPHISMFHVSLRWFSLRSGILWEPVALCKNFWSTLGIGQ